MISEDLNVPIGNDNCDVETEQAAPAEDVAAPKEDGAVTMMSSDELYQTARPDLKKHFDIQVSGIWRGREEGSEGLAGPGRVRENPEVRVLRRTPVIRSAASPINEDSRLSARAYQTIKAPVLPVFEKNVDSLAVLKKLLAHSNRSHRVARSEAQSKPVSLTTEFVKPPSESRGFDFSLGHFAGERNDDRLDRETQINPQDAVSANGAIDVPEMLSPESFRPQQSTLFSIGGGLKREGEAPEMLSSESFTSQQSTLFSIGGGFRNGREVPDMLSADRMTASPSQDLLIGGRFKKDDLQSVNDAMSIEETHAEPSDEVLDYGPILSPEELIESAEKNRRAFQFVINPNVARDMRRGYETAEYSDEREKDTIRDNQQSHVNNSREVERVEAETGNELLGMAALCFEQAFIKMIRKLWAEEFYPAVERRIEARFERLEAAIMNAHRNQASDDTKISSTKYDTNSEDFCI